jgi:hypothetical protein
MSQAAVEDILRQIETLTVEDRALLEERLLGVLDAEWERAAVEVRQDAKRRGLDQKAVDQAVSDLRRGQ